MASGEMNFIENLWNSSQEDNSVTQNGVPRKVQELLNQAFAKIPVSTFPLSDIGKVVEISSDASIVEAVQLLSQHNILSVPVRRAGVEDGPDISWADRYLGMLDFSAIVLWILEQAETAAATLAAGTGAAAGVGAGALGALGAVALGLSGPLLVAGLTAAAIGAALTGRLVVERTIGNSPHETVAALGAEFYKVILQEEPFKSAKVADITRTYRWAPFCAIRLDDSMLTVLLLLSQFRMRSVPVLGNGEATLGNLITQSGVIAGLASCRGVDWFDFITSKSLEQLGLPRMAPSEVVTVDAEALVLEAFFLMRTKNVGGLPVTDGPGRRLVANISVRDVQYLLLRTDLFAQRKYVYCRRPLDKHSKPTGGQSTKGMAQ
eukprot:TRINITY_DN187_c0_g1_i1.p1 TRINITY_DN187_c0_g1~~TRINITY_DN187_c0_g1_i1.p1  ORF type:complete len:377 (-),score=77.97 TRINITY_DN187_c0_g1_i1:41-1171(-)